VPGPLAQKPKPDFSGKWRLVSESGAAQAPALVVQPDLTITQTADTLTAVEPAGGRSITMVYKLDGSALSQTVNRAEVVTKASWDGDALVTTVTGQSANWKDVWHLTGTRLTIDTTMPGRELASKRAYDRM